MYLTQDDLCTEILGIWFANPGLWEYLFCFSQLKLKNKNVNDHLNLLLQNLCQLASILFLKNIYMIKDIICIKNLYMEMKVDDGS